MGMLAPAVYHHIVGGQIPASKLPSLETMSLLISGILIVNYVCGLIFSLKTHRHLYDGRGTQAGDYVIAGGQTDHGREGKTAWMTVLVVLLAATACVAVASELLVATIEPVIHRWGLRQVFVGAVIIAMIGNAAEHSTAVLVAMRNKMDLAMQICVGSSIQVALFVTPALVFISLALGRPMTLEFTPVEILAVVSSILVVMNIAQLISLYGVLAVAFYFV
jgi:Ca2+:H+ antiporter